MFARFSFDYCGDMIWSGHTERVIVGIVSLQRIFRDRKGDDWFNQHKIPIYLVSVVYFGIVVALMISVHFHYSVDILLAVIIAGAFLTHKDFLAFGVMFFEEYSLWWPTTKSFKTTAHGLRSKVYAADAEAAGEK